jgi:hypothetical protein
MSDEIIFHESVEIEEKSKILKIKISCEYRRHAGVVKSIFTKNILDLVPLELKDDVEIISSPNKLVSNINSPKYIREGIWEFRIKEKQKKAPVKNNNIIKKTRRTRIKKSPQNKKLDN